MNGTSLISLILILYFLFLIFLHYSEVLMTTLDVDESGEIGFHEFEQVFGGMSYPGDKRSDTKQ